MSKEIKDSTQPVPKTKCNIPMFLHHTKTEYTSSNKKTAATIVTTLGFKAFIPVADDMISVFDLSETGCVSIYRYSRYESNKLWKAYKEGGFVAIDSEWGHLQLNVALSANGLPTLEYDAIKELGLKDTLTADMLLEKIRNRQIQSQGRALRPKIGALPLPLNKGPIGIGMDNKEFGESLKEVFEQSMQEVKPKMVPEYFPEHDAHFMVEESNEDEEWAEVDAQIEAENAKNRIQDKILERGNNRRIEKNLRNLARSLKISK